MTGPSDVCDFFKMGERAGHFQSKRFQFRFWSSKLTKIFGENSGMFGNECWKRGGVGEKFGSIQKMQIVDRFKNLKSFEGGPGGGRIQLNFKHLLKYADICGRPK